MINWPALEKYDDGTLPDIIGSSLESAIIGKADKVSTDFRLLAKSRQAYAYDPSMFYLGSENSPVDTLAWFNHGGISQAIHIYPSQARDSANRGGTLEKQLMEYVNDIGKCPFILYQLALLLRVKGYREGEWWARRDDYSWNDPKYVLDVSQKPPIRKEEIIKARTILLEKGLPNIKLFLSKEEMVSFYKKILSGADFIPLRTLQKKTIPIEVFLALFLPLKKEDFKKLSFVLQFPQGRVQNQQVLKKHWNIIPDFDKEVTSVAQKDESIFANFAETCAEAVRDGNASKELHVEPRTTPRQQEGVGLSAKQIPRKAGRRSEPLVSSEQHDVMEWTPGWIDRSSPVSFYGHPDCQLKHYRPSNDSHKFVKKLYRYLCSGKVEPNWESYSDVTVPQYLSKDDQNLLSKWHDNLNGLYEKTESRSVLLKIEFFKTGYFYIDMTKGVFFEIITNDVNGLITKKIPVLLWFYKHLYNQGNIILSERKISEILNDKVSSEFFEPSDVEILVSAFHQSLNIVDANSYQDNMKKIFKIFYYSETSYMKKYKKEFLKLESYIS